MKLVDHPFYLLGADPHCNQWKLSALASKKGIQNKDINYQQVLRRLTDPQNRLREELRWFPGCSADTVNTLISIIESDTAQSVPDIAKIPTISAFNFHMYTFVKQQPKAAKDLYAMYIQLFIAFARLTSSDLLELIHADRKIAKFPAIASIADVEQELKHLWTDAKDMVHSAVSQLSDKERETFYQLIRDNMSHATNKKYAHAIAGFNKAPDPNASIPITKASAATSVVSEKKMTTTAAAAAATTASVEMNHQATAYRVQSQPITKRDRAYQVMLPVDLVAVPSLCTCCLTPTHKKVYVKELQHPFKSESEKHNAISQEFSLCEDCQNHRSRFREKNVGLMALAIFVTFFMTLLTSQRGIPMGFVLSILCGFAAYIVPAYKWVKAPTLGDTHAAHETSVSIAPVDSLRKMAYYTFANQQYAELFANINKGQLEEIETRNTAEQPSLLLSLANPIHTLWKPALCIVLVAIIFRV